MSDDNPQLLRRYFSTVERLDGEEDGNFGGNYRCTRADSEERFVKVREQSKNNWFLWGLRKEHAVTSALGLERPDIPAADALLSNDAHLAISFPRITTGTSLGDIYDDLTLYRQVRDDLVDLRLFLDGIDEDDYLAVGAIADKDQWYDETLGNTEAYFFDDRFAGGVFFSDIAYDQYEPLLEICRKEARTRYDPSNRRLIHGDLANTANVLLSDDGVRAAVDWEMSSWFDRRVDIAAIETSFIDDIALHHNELSLEEERATFRSMFDLDSEDETAINAYKAWQHYVALEVYLSSDEMPFSPPEPATLEAARSRRYQLLDGLANEFDVSL